MWTWITLGANTSLQQLIATLNIRLRALQQYLAAFESLTAGVADIADGDTTPALGTYGIFRTGNTSATTITGFDGVTGPAKKVLIFLDDNTTLQHGANLQLTGDADYTAETGDVMILVTDDGTVWREAPQPPRWS